MSEILKLTNKQDWGHFPGHGNPADLGSRGEIATKLKESKLWDKGPCWLSEPESNWPSKERIVR